MTRAGWRLPGYRIEELLGTGASSEVWRAKVVATGVAVALKRIWVAQAEQRAAALTEAAMLQTLDHPNLMRLHEVRRVDDDAIVLVLDLAAGGTLANLLARRGRLTVGETVAALSPVAAALAYAHNAGVVHGDVSAANVLFTDIGLPLLADLGVSRLLGADLPVRTTPSYIDPMVAAGDRPSPASDVFMLGAIALHALTGAPPWTGSDAQQLVEQAALGDQPDFRGRLHAAGAGDEVTAVVGRALSIEPTERGTATDFALELRTAATPVAVELRAGRAHRLPPGSPDSWALESVRLPAGASDESAGSAPVPPFEGEPPITYGVRPPAPFPAGRHSARSPHRRRNMALAAALIVALAVLAATLWRPGGHDGRARAAAHPRAASASASRAGPPRSPASSPVSSPAPRPRGTTTPSLADALSRLDTTRAAAYAERDPGRLAEVYASATLLARDRALLLSAVPAGCGLRGVRTTFTGVRVLARTPTTVRVQVTATVHASTLMCQATPAGRAAGSAPAKLVMELVRDRTGYRIAAEYTA